MRPLIKTTIVIWSEADLAVDQFDIEDLARNATIGDSFCSRVSSNLISHPALDPDWVDTEFFEDEDEDI